MNRKTSHTGMLVSATLGLTLTFAGPVVSAAPLSPELAKKSRRQSMAIQNG